MNTAITLLAYSVVLFITAVEALVLYQIATNRINLQLLISDDNGDASLSRFQFLLFTFIIGAGLLHLTLKGSAFPTVNEGILMLLGISGATYAIGKSLDKPTGTTSSSGTTATVAGSKITQTSAAE
ncbi:MAG: hypothetical protein WDO74_06975 [Pseudomonadota bacterium]